MKKTNRPEAEQHPVESPVIVQTLGLIRAFFSRGKHTLPPQDNAPLLYKAVRCLCEEDWIPLKPAEQIQRLSGGACTLRDIARVSHFPVRRVILEDGWQKNDHGNLLVYVRIDGERVPCACCMDPFRHYHIYNPLSGKKTKLVSGLLPDIEREAYMLYRPLPAGPMTFFDLTVFGLRQRSRGDLPVFIVLTVATMLLNQLLPWLTKMIYDMYLPFDNLESIKHVCVVVLTMNIGSLVFTAVKSLASYRWFSRLRYRIQAAVFDRLFNMKSEDIRHYETADLGNRAMSISEISETLSGSFLNAAFSFITALAFLFSMFQLSGYLTLWLMGALILCLLPLVLLQIRQKRRVMESVRLKNEAASTEYQMVGGMMNIKIMGAEDRAVRYFFTRHLPSVKAEMKSDRAQNHVAVYSAACASVLIMLEYFLMFKTMSDFSMGAFVGFSSAFGMLSAAVFSLADACSRSICVLPMLDRVRPILEATPEYEDGQTVPAELTGAIEVDHLSFSYNKGANKVLDDISFSVRPGEYVGLVGSSGCGKSTLLRLLLGFEEADNGQIYYDGYKIGHLNKSELRRRMGVVLQNGTVFSGSIADNILITSPEAGEEELWEALRTVGLDNVVEKLPMGIHTMLTAGGGTISGGQQQRILLARALINKPKIILLDEATSALDNVAQRVVQENLDRMKVTRIVIAHRLSTVVHCDRILVLHDGKIEQQGTYDELMKENGLFRRLVERQMA